MLMLPSSQPTFSAPASSPQKQDSQQQPPMVPQLQQSLGLNPWLLGHESAQLQQKLNSHNLHDLVAKIQASRNMNLNDALLGSNQQLQQQQQNTYGLHLQQLLMQQQLAAAQHQALPSFNQQQLSLLHQQQQLQNALSKAIQSSQGSALLASQLAQLDGQRNFAAQQQEQQQRSIMSAQQAISSLTNPLIQELYKANGASQQVSVPSGITVEFLLVDKWSKSYIRTRQKNLRCFPACSAYHKENNFCGRSIRIRVEGAPKQSNLVVFGYFCRDDTPIMLEVGEITSPALPLRIDSNEIVHGTLSTTTGDGMEFEFLPPRRWKYHCSLIRFSGVLRHCFRIYVCQTSPANPRRLQCIKIQNSPSFCVRSAWRHSASTGVATDNKEDNEHATENKEDNEHATENKEDNEHATPQNETDHEDHTCHDYQSVDTVTRKRDHSNVGEEEHEPVTKQTRQ